MAVVCYIRARSALRALVRADRAEEISRLQRREAELLMREAEFNQSFTQGSEHLLQVLVLVANGDQGVRSSLNRDHPLWRISNAFNVLLARVGRMANAEQEIQRLRVTIARLIERVFDRERGQRQTPPPTRPVTPLSKPGTPPAMPSVPNARPIRHTPL